MNKIIIFSFLVIFFSKIEGNQFNDDFLRQANFTKFEIKTIKLVNCPPDHVIAPCRCSKFNINYLKSEIMNSMYHNLDDYNKVNVYLICSFNNENFNLTEVFNKISSFYIKGNEQFVMKTRKDDGKFIITHSLAEDNLSSLDPQSRHEIKDYGYKQIQLNIYGLILNSIPHSKYEFDFGNIVFNYIDISYTRLRKISFKKKPFLTTFNGVHTLILAYNQLENDLDETIDLPIKMTRLAIEINKFSNLQVLILKGNQLKQFNIPKSHINLKQVLSSQKLYENVNSWQDTKNSKINRLIDEFNRNFKEKSTENIEDQRFIENKMKVFEKLLLLDVSENRIELIAPTSYKFLPKLIHLNLMSNNIQKIFGRSFIFPNNQTKLNMNTDYETIITDLDKIFDQSLDDFLKNKSLSKQTSRSFYDYGTFSFENKTNEQKKNSPLVQENVINIYLGGNDLDCSKINQFAFVKIEKKFTIHLDLNNFEYICEDIFENLLSNPNLMWINLHKNAIKCLHCGNRWLFTSKLKVDTTSNIEQYEKIREDDLELHKQKLYGKNFTKQHNSLQPIVTGQQDPKPIKYDLNKLANIKCVNPLAYDLQINKPGEIILLQDFTLNSFTHCNLKRKQLIQSLKHFALFLKAFNVLPKSNLDRINEILN